MKPAFAKATASKKCSKRSPLKSLDASLFEPKTNTKTIKADGKTLVQAELKKGARCVHGIKTGLKAGAKTEVLGRLDSKNLNGSKLNSVGGKAAVGDFFAKINKKAASKAGLKTCFAAAFYHLSFLIHHSNEA